MKALCVSIGLILVGAIVAGVMLGNSELLSPTLHAAQADKIKAETAALRAQAAYEQRQREIELRLAEQKAAVELRALQARRAKELELLKIAGIVGSIVGSAVMITLAAAVSYYLIARTRTLPKVMPLVWPQPDYKRRHYPTGILPEVFSKKAKSMTSPLNPELDSKTEKVHTIASGLYASCQVNRDYYRELDMEIEAHVFDAYMKRIEDKFGILSSLTLTSEKVDQRLNPQKKCVGIS